MEVAQNMNAAPNPELMKHNGKLSFADLVAAVSQGQRIPEQSQFAGIDIKAARLKRMQELSKETDSGKAAFNKQFAELFWLTAFPLVEAKDLGTIKKGPCWVFDPELTSALQKGTDENLVILQPHLGFNYAVSEVLWMGKNLLVLNVRPQQAFSEARLHNVTLVFAHGDQKSYGSDVASVTNFAVQDSLPVGLLLNE